MNKLVARVKAILMSPKTEWPLIAAEPTTVADLYKNYIAILAAIPVIAGFIKGSLIGYGAFGLHYRTPIGAGIASAIISYVLGLVLVYVVALIVEALAPTFGAQKDRVQALKTVAYAYTASWVAGVALIIPGIGWLVALAGAIYGVYLLYLGLPFTMKAPQEKAGGYTAVTVIITIVLGWIVGLIVAGVAGTGAMMAGGMQGVDLGNRGGQVSVDADSSLGQLAAWGKKMEAAGQQMDAAEKSGDADAQSKALGAMMGAAMGSGEVEALAPDMLKPFLPETLAGFNRTDFSAERNGALGMQVSEARASYTDGGARTLQLEVTDMGSAKGLMAMAGWAGVQNEREDANGYDKTYKQAGRLVHEKWDRQSNSGEYGIVLGNRFQVKASGEADSIDQLKAAVAGVNLAGLEALKDHGVKEG
jgi:hypothetical protein